MRKGTMDDGYSRYLPQQTLLFTQYAIRNRHGTPVAKCSLTDCKCYTSDTRKGKVHEGLCTIDPAPHGWPAAGGPWGAEAVRLVRRPRTAGYGRLARIDGTAPGQAVGIAGGPLRVRRRAPHRPGLPQPARLP